MMILCRFESDWEAADFDAAGMFDDCLRAILSCTMISFATEKRRPCGCNNLVLGDCLELMYVGCRKVGKIERVHLGVVEGR